MKCKRPKHSLTPFRVAWPTACRFTQRPCGQYNSAGGICQISSAGGLQRVEKPILSFRGAPQGYLLRGAKRRGNPRSFGCKFAEKRKNCAIWERIATPVCGLARNDTAVRCWADRVVRPTDGHKGCGGKTAGRCGHRPLRNDRRKNVRRGGALPRPKVTIPPSAQSADTFLCTREAYGFSFIPASFPALPAYG